MPVDRILRYHGGLLSVDWTHWTLRLCRSVVHAEISIDSPSIGLIKWSPFDGAHKFKLVKSPNLLEFYWDRSSDGSECAGQHQSIDSNLSDRLWSPIWIALKFTACSSELVSKFIQLIFTRLILLSFQSPDWPPVAWPSRLVIWIIWFDWIAAQKLKAPNASSSFRNSFNKGLSISVKV